MDQWKYNKIKEINPDVKFRHLPIPADPNAFIISKLPDEIKQTIKEQWKWISGNIIKL